MPPGGSMGLRYILKILLSRKSQIPNNSTTTKAREKLNTDLECLEFQTFFDVCLIKLKKSNFT